jgi:hypothetical protein
MWRYTMRRQMRCRSVNRSKSATFNPHALVLPAATKTARTVIDKKITNFGMFSGAKTALQCVMPLSSTLTSAV